jgi:hypothetical protein
VGTFILTMIISLTVVIGGGPSDGQPNLGPLLIGFAVFVAHIVLIPFTGCGINPARTFGPALVNSLGGQNQWGPWSWIYYAGPAFGSIMSAGVFYMLKDDSAPVVKRRLSNHPDGASIEGGISLEAIAAEVAEAPHKYHMQDGALSTGFNAAVN